MDKKILKKKAVEQKQEESSESGKKYKLKKVCRKKIGEK